MMLQSLNHEIFWICAFLLFLTIVSPLAHRFPRDQPWIQQLSFLKHVLLIFWPLIFIITCLSHLESKSPIVGFAPLFTGVQRLKYHEINHPHKSSKVVLIGGSNIASWGNDYRWGSAEYQHKYDYWGRSSIAFFLAQELHQRGHQLEVHNLAINGGSLRDDFFMFLWAVNQGADTILYGGNAAGLLYGGGFRFLPIMNDGIEKMLALQQYGEKSKREPRFLEYLKTQSKIPYQTPKVSCWDSAVAVTGRGLQEVYRWIGLPPIVVKIQEPTAELTKQFAITDEAQRQNVITQFEQVLQSPFAEVVPIMASIARTHGIRFEIFFSPDHYEIDKELQRRYLPLIESTGIKVFDLTDMETQVGKETYDGVHHNQFGNRKIALALARHYWQ